MTIKIHESFKNNFHPIIVDPDTEKKTYHGWSERINPFPRYGIVIHTTNGRKGSAFVSEFNYLLHTPKVSAHFLISREGQIWQLLPVEYCAWHAGAVNDEQYSNNNSIGIEMHYSPGEIRNWAQIRALSELCRYLYHTYPIADVKMHREVCRPKYRKIDPSNMTNIEFTVWRNELKP